MNEKMGAYLAVGFLFFVGFFNIVYVLVNLKNRKANKGLLWARFAAGFLIFCLSLGAGYYFIWLK